MNEKLTQIKNVIDKRLEELFSLDIPDTLRDAMYYSVEAGGKRIRPTLTLLAAELFSADTAEVLDIACAVEMIHTYSLIHDDLPALDNDTLRRGKATNHVMFGEAQAILAGDGLLNYAYETMLQNTLMYSNNLASHVSAIKMVANAAGIGGMIAGQVQDVLLEGKEISFAELSYIHAHKTGALITAALIAGILPYHPNAAQFDAIKTYGEKIGLVFQIVDDILDVTGDDSLGKSRGKDERDNKTTYVSLFGIDAAQEKAEILTKEAKEAVAMFGEKANWLTAFADMLLNRTF